MMDTLFNFKLEDLEIMGRSIVQIISIVSQTAMVLGGVVPFIPQYLDIRRTHNTEGFSLFVCLTLLIANILRIMFWFGKHFELPLLVQSIIMIFAMLVLVELCVRVNQTNEIISSRSRRFTDFDPEHFWKWTDFLSYVEFSLTFTLLVGIVTLLLINVPVYVELLGFAAVFTEAMLGAPQFYRNFQNKSTVGMSKKMVAFWTCGDVFKTVYFILREAPAQFWICGMLQVSIDIAIFLQVLIYMNNPLLVVKKQSKPAIS
ncbi:PQ-loop repeat-containing protein 1-like isoform X2 [Pomacea canaliculata]|uniref:PQ-loop repeat-containing protein 1-like isoform X2 n=1 Tax=Pomacea canaliculata TaxID=400727 RepID=UPI000D73B6E8|nr:PQ-loop repeat-containing protein 1-like isoform X2 [Pomacea canaliculata]